MLDEARAGHYACHVANVMDQGTYSPTKVTKSLRLALSEWSEGSLRSVEHIILDSDDNSGNDVILDGELLRLLVGDWTKGAKTL